MQIYEIRKDKVYFACENFDTVFKEILSKSTSQKFSIVTNLPYLDQNSKDHMPYNQLMSAYKKFDQMLKKSHSEGIIENAFVFINNSNISDRSHFLKISEEKWELLE